MRLTPELYDIIVESTIAAYSMDGVTYTRREVSEMLDKLLLVYDIRSLAPIDMNWMKK